MAQSTITSYFAYRKRSALDDHKSASKVMILDSKASTGDAKVRLEVQDSVSQPPSQKKIETKVVYKVVSNKNVDQPKQQASVASASKSKKILRPSKGKKLQTKEANQSDMKAFLDKKNEPKETVADEIPKETEEKKEQEKQEEKMEKINPKPTDQKGKISNIEKARKELSLGDIKAKLTRSARLAELKESMARFERGRNKLKELEEKNNASTERTTDSKPQLNQFNSIQLEVPLSPVKSPMKSPLTSPRKTPGSPKSPAFQRYLSLAESGVPAFPLPYSYRHLAEVFRCVDTVVSLMSNRKEIIFFHKLQPAVQEMSRRNFTLHHLAQMLTVFPEAYNLKHEKIKCYGSDSKQEKYGLVLSPILSSNGGDQTSLMSSSVLLERRRSFYNSLLNMAKKQHEIFLSTLDPPIEIEMSKLTRWHPGFDVDQVPEITAAPLPQPPNQDKCCSAKDVLDKARTLYSCNSRVEKALQSVAQSKNESESKEHQGRSVHIEVVERPSSPVNPPVSPFKSMQLSSALNGMKGIPKALLEKVRARAAAKAMEAMTRSAAQDKEVAKYSRLPELARILRNIFVAEKKGALPLETVLEKVGNSFRSVLSKSELEDHIRLLEKSVPGWISFEHLLKTDYLKLSKGGDMSRVIKKLESLIDQKSGSV